MAKPGRVREKPILMYASEVRATLEDRKTMTRRIVKPQPEFIYGITGDRITPVFLHSEAINELNQAGIGRCSKAYSDLPELGLYGGKRWAHLLANTLQRLRQEGLCGLVCVSRSSKREGVFDCLVVPRKQESDEACASARVHGLSRNATFPDCAGSSSRRHAGELCAGQSEMGLTTGQLVGPQGAWPRNQWRETSRSEADGRGTRTLAVGVTDRVVQSASCRSNAWDEPSCNISYCRYKVGARLWVRETWAAPWGRDYVMPTGQRGIFYRADDGRCLDNDGRWTPSIHMPRWASRITLEITGVRVERLQEISEAEAKAEGITQDDADDELRIAELMNQREPKPFTARYRTLWDSINAKRAPWASNPYVWVVEFKRI